MLTMTTGSSMTAPTPLEAGIVSAVFLILCLVIRRLLLPKPIPGVPHYEESANRISGDLPRVVADFERDKEVSMTRYEHCRKLASPIIQLFINPLGRPWVFIDDPREAEDILLRRNKEFDRSHVSMDTIGLIMPHCTIVKPTGSAWKNQRRLWIDIMAPDFLRRVVAPKIHRSAMELIELWRLKSAKEQGKPVDVTHDFDTAAFDAIWYAILGDELGGIRDKINAIGKPDLNSSTTQGRGLNMLKTVRLLDESVLAMDKAWFPALSKWILRNRADFRKYNQIRNNEINRLIIVATARFQRLLDGTTDGSEHDTCAMDLVLRREMLLAMKSGAPITDPTTNPQLRDELMLLMWAGHDTTSNTLSWFVKYLTNSPEVQATLRKRLRDAFPRPSLPDAAEIIESDIPYLDGAIEESLRLAATTGRVNRITTVDTEILGHKVPAGTDIVLNGTMTKRPVPIDEQLRSLSSREAAGKRRLGSGIDGPAGDDLASFQPERWLVTTDDGKESFDAYALPRLAFGNGPRGCFGRRLAMQELRIMITLLVLSFEMEPVPQSLNSMRGIELMFRKPEQCYLKLKTL